MDDTQLSIIKQAKVRLYTHYKQLSHMNTVLPICKLFILLTYLLLLNIFGYMTTINAIKTTTNFKYFRSRLAVWSVVETLMSDFEIGELHDYMILSYFQEF